MVAMAPSAARARAEALARVTRGLRPGSRLLDLGCGTGGDAVALARRGHSVLGVDSSPEMLAAASARRDAARVPAHACAFRQLRAGDAGALADEGLRFDAAFSYYAVLNLEPRLDACAEGVAGLLPEGARFVVGLLNPTALFEIALYPFALRLKGYRKAAQRPVRLKLATHGELDVACHLYGVDAFARRMRPWFELREAVGLHVFLPPPRGPLLRMPALLAMANRFESRLQHRAPFNRLGYFSLLVLERTRATATRPRA
jgi:SAM-dependent methyltransferase